MTASVSALTPPSHVLAPQATRTLTSVLVANRGEIARRVFRTARSMGLRAVAVYVAADAQAPFVGEADEAILLAGSYLDGDAIVAAAVRAGADAVHPGYGFLSENGCFAAAVAAAGLAWVGPTPAVIEAMGDKLAAKRIAAAHGVPTLPSTEDAGRAEEIGFPILIKAAAGGGGKGMRIAQDAAALAESVAAARREAASGFGDDRVFLERYVARSRHVEIQILGDHHGRLVHLGERECSIQRRHQKIIEESPSPIVDSGLRAAMGRAALTLAGALGYQSAGTVEFLVDEETREFYFLEVNTRLQVEHPVTEAVTGIDLVREQLHIAAGQPLGYTQESITLTGHAIEARLYAEDPDAGFLPATGRLVAFEPAPAPLVRYDAGVERGSVVGLDFDPMLAKVISHAPTRAEAAGRLALALESLHIGGVRTNASFLAATLRHPAFLAGDTTTDFIKRHRPAAQAGVDVAELEFLATAGVFWLAGRNRSQATVLRSLPSGWRNGRLPALQTVLTTCGQTVAVSYRQQRDGSFLLKSGVRVVVHAWHEDVIDVEIGARRRRIRMTAAEDRIHVQSSRGTIECVVQPRFPQLDAAGRAGGLVAPMPGVASDVRVAVGDHVARGQVLVVLEAMKMEHHIVAPVDGTITGVRVATGVQVATGEALLVLEPAEGGEQS